MMKGLAVDRAGLVAVGQVGLMLVSGVATALAIIAFLTLMVMCALLLLSILLGIRQEMVWDGPLGIPMLLLLPTAWLGACWTIVQGLQAIYDPGLIRTARLVAQCGLLLLVCHAALYGV
jgi:hypothetical protein